MHLVALPELKPPEGPTIAIYHTIQEISYRTSWPPQTPTSIMLNCLSYLTAVVSGGQMSKEINVAGIMQANTFADHELLLMNKYSLEYRAGSKNNNNKNRMRDQSTYSYCLLSKNVYPVLFLPCLWDTRTIIFTSYSTGLYLMCNTWTLSLTLRFYFYIYSNSCFMVTLMQIVKHT